MIARARGTAAQLFIDTSNTVILRISFAVQLLVCSSSITSRVLDTELFLRHATVIFAESSMRNVDNWTFCYAIWRSCRSESCKAVAYLICPHEGVTDS